MSIKKLQIITYYYFFGSIWLNIEIESEMQSCFGCEGIEEFESGKKKGVESLIFVNDGADMFPFEGLGNISLLQAIDDLNLVDHLAVLEDFKARTFYN